MKWSRLLFPPRPAYRALLLSYSGRFREAEEIHRRLAARARSSTVRARALAMLGGVLTWEAGYEEARECLEEAPRLDARQWLAQQNLCHWYLIQSLDPGAALVLIEQAIRNQSGAVEAFHLALKAWALARLSRPAEARVAIDDAVCTADQRYLPGLAAVHLAAGCACSAMPDTGKARAHFRQAAYVDASGRWGAAASRLLQA